MIDRFERTGTIVWAVICILTVISLYIGEHPASLRFLNHGTLPLIILAIAVVKVRLIIMHFMEIGRSPLGLRLIFELWIGLVFVMVLVMFVKGQEP